MRTEIYTSITYNQLQDLKQLVNYLDSKLSIGESEPIEIICSSEGMDDIDEDVIIGLKSSENDFFLNIHHSECYLLASTLKCFYDVNRDFLIHKK